MDAESRQTASAYINNLLLSRGLLRNGTPIEFAKPEEAEGGIHSTMSQVMNLVHDLILRRDRESTHLATLSTTLSHLRTTSTAQTTHITKLESSNAQLDRQLALTTAQERAARATLRSAETRNRALREEIARLKASVAQVRAQCATDVRRRDGEIGRLKKHLEGKRGGAGGREGGAGGGVGVVVVTPGVGGGAGGGGRSQGGGGVLGEGNYNGERSGDGLKQETTEFLTRLSQGLSDENDALIGLVRGTLATLRSLQGLPEWEMPGGGEGGLGGGGESERDINGFMHGPPSYEALAMSTDEVLEHLRGLLTNPSFVPLEEVEVREEEIQRLREGWEKMAVRWKEAVSLMNGWKSRMVESGDTINLDDLRDGLKLGSGIPSAMEARVSPAKMQKDAEAAMDTSSMLQVLQEQQDDILRDTLEAEPIDEADLVVPATGRALTDRSANPRPVQPSRAFSFPSIPEEHAKDIETDEELSLLDFSSKEAPKVSHARKKTSRIPLQARPRSPAPTVQEKLERAQAEAEETRRQEEKRSKRQNTTKNVNRKLKGSRRRSTLSPEELENLMGVAR